MLESIGLNTAVEGLRAYPAAAPLVIFGILVLEGVVVTTFIFSATLTILAAGALVQAGILSYAGVFAAVFLGLWTGDAINFKLARRGESWFRQLRSVQKHADLLDRAEKMVLRWGLIAIFVSRFMGPTRPFVTFLAGLLKIPATRFHLVTMLATLLLTFALMHLGEGGMAVLQRWFAQPDPECEIFTPAEWGAARRKG